jgi:F-type H+-transporting ATPase subunit delta
MRKIVNRFAKILLDISKERNCVDEVREELEKEIGILMNPRLRRILKHPSVDLNEKKHLLSESLSHISHKDVILPYLNSLVEEDANAIDWIKEILERYEKLSDEVQNRVKVEVDVAVALEENELNRLMDELRKVVGGEVRMVVRVNPSLLGGVRVKIKDRVIDGSVRSALCRLEERLATS